MSNNERIPWPPYLVLETVFDEVAEIVSSYRRGAEGAGTDHQLLRHAELLALLKDCEFGDGTGASVGASYKQLAMIGHMVGMDGAERSAWYDAAAFIGLTQRHVGHIITRIQDGTFQRNREKAAREDGRTGKVVYLFGPNGAEETA